MKYAKVLGGALALISFIASETPPSAAQDMLKVAVGQINNWENQMTTLGQDAGIFKKHGIVLENVGTQGAGETVQAVISGSADIGIGVGTSAAMRAFSKGAPVRVLAAGFTGTGDLYWYVRADSPIKSLKEATDKHTIAYSTSGSTSNNIVLGFAKQLGVKAKPTATGGPPQTFTQVMSGQIDIGWAAPPFGLDAIDEGKIRIVAYGSDVLTTRNQTVRVTIVNADALKNKKNTIERFARAYRETIEWMYSNPQAIKMYAEKIRKPEKLLTLSRDKFHPKEAMQPDRLLNVEGVMADAVEVKILEAPLTKEQLAEFFPFPSLGK